MNVFNHKRKRPQIETYDIAGALLSFLDKMKPYRAEQQTVCDEKQFTLLLSGVFGLRKIPGISQAMGYEKLYLCWKDGGDVDALKKHCKKLYGADDWAGLEAFMERDYNTQNEYSQFRTFWKGHPCFDVNTLDVRGKLLFEACKGFAEILAPIAGRKGFFAFDCTERLGVLRLAYAAGMINEQQFWDKALPLAAAASDRYDSWLEYAAGYLCGACYDMFRAQMAESQTVDKQEMKDYVEMNCRLMEQLLTHVELWGGHKWYKRPPKKLKLSPAEIRMVLTDYQGGDKVVCIASDRITVDGCPVGYLYREQPINEQAPDSGWRIFAGDESKSYMADATNFDFYHLNTICNYDQTIIELLNAPYGTEYRRGLTGRWIEKER